MQEGLKDSLEQALIEMINAAVSVKDFIVAETPEVVNQLLIWKCAESAIYAIFSILLVGLSIYMWKKIIQKEREVKREFESGMGYAIGTVATLLVLIPSVVGFFNLDWLKILIAPKLYLIEYTAELIK
jgi:hypothetical protein